jgi:ABC-type branched-subunit amino acid transport system substrate-binding protein
VFTVGMVVPLSGPGGIYGPSAEAVTELAVREINADGGVLGSELRVTMIDGGSASRIMTAQVAGLLRSREIQAVAGWHISSVRNVLVPIVAKRVPYLYSALYEGGEHRSGTYCTGEVPRNQLAPALDWLHANTGARRWFVVGDDYVWPRRSYQSVVEHASQLDIIIVGHSFVRDSDAGRADSMPKLMEDIARSGCDGVLVLMVGQNAVSFNRAFARRGLDEAILRFGPLMEENTLLASGISATHGLYSAGAYYRSLTTVSSLDLVSRYAALYGSSGPALNGPAESCYEGLYALQSILHRAGSADVSATDSIIDGHSYDGPRGPVSFAGNQATQQLYMSAAAGFDFDVLAAL